MALITTALTDDSEPLAQQVLAVLADRPSEQDRHLLVAALAHYASRALVEVATLTGQAPQEWVTRQALEYMKDPTP